MSPSDLPSIAADSSPRPGVAAGCASGWECRIAPAARRDHPAVFHFLTAVFQRPSRDEFRAQLEDPAYEPRQRLLGRIDSEIVGHVQWGPRVMQFGSGGVPVAWLGWLGVLPQWGGRGLGRRLLAAAEQAAARSGASVGLLWTRIPEFFRRAGWVGLGPRTCSRAGTHEILAVLAARGLYPRSRRRCAVRPWRRLEMGSVVALYNRNLAGAYGPFQRSETYWKWLVERHGYQQFYVTHHGHEDAEGPPAPITGYAAIRGERIVELLTMPESPAAAVDLLVRACGDAIECGQHTIRVHAPPDHRVHHLVHSARGAHPAGLEPDGDGILMARLLDPLRLLRLLAGELAGRARGAGVPPATALGISDGRRKCRLDFQDQGVRVISRRLGPDWVGLQPHDFAQMLLGHLDWDEAMGSGRVRAGSPTALGLAQALFPRLPCWHPLLDDLPARD